jgi:cyanophycinase-like exopeptidase
MGPIGLHGGGEFLAGDEPFLRLLLDAAASPAEERARASGGPADDPLAGAIRIAIVPAAAARQRPELAGAHGVAAFRAIAAERDRDARPEVVPITDRASAADPRLAARLAAADLIHLPGGDPDLVIAILEGTLAWRSIVTARARGAVVAGASAGAMALGEWTWTPAGGRPGLGLVRGLAVAPHFEGVPAERWRAEREALPRRDLGILGLAERTGVLSETGLGGSAAWRVAGPGTATWIGPNGVDPVVAGDGATVELSGSTLASA